MSPIESTQKINMPINSCHQAHQSPDPCTCTDAGCRYYPAKNFVRPRFFAGQMLTEDDLSLLSFYIAEKNRMHNRYLFGDGVVCGLEVICHPCGDGRVMVQPGYALDCCGNDIYVPCPIELDINAMVREFRINRRGGYDCGDPCEDPQNPERRYCLYLRYCEQSTDPVAPYQTDEPCGNVDCEPTRIYEGFRFELDCEETPETVHDLASHMCECLGDPSKVSQIKSDRDILINRIPDWQIALTKWSEDSPTDLEEKDFDHLKNFAELILKHPDIENQGENKAKEYVSQMSKEQIDKILFQLPHFIAGMYKYALKPTQEISNQNKEKLKILTDNEKIIKRIKAIVNNLALKKGIEKSFITGLQKYPDELAISIDKIKPIEASSKNKWIAYGLWQIAEAQDDVINALIRIQEFILCKLDTATHLADCSIYDQINKIMIPRIGEKQVDFNMESSLIRAAKTLVYALDRFFEDCFCHALNPPCTPCEDQRVLIACLEVKDCKVVDICNMKRSYVISPTATRYWLPWISEIGRVMERACCETSICHDERGAEVVQEKWPIKDQPPFLSSAFLFLAKRPLSLENLAGLFYHTICHSRMGESWPVKEIDRLIASSFYKLFLNEDPIKEMLPPKSVVVDRIALQEKDNKIENLESRIKALETQTKNFQKAAGTQTALAKKAAGKQPAKKRNLKKTIGVMLYE